MVLEDIFNSPNNSKNKKEDSNLASPLDRLASVMADMPLVLPIISVIIAPFQKDILVAQYTSQSDLFVKNLFFSFASGFMFLFLYYFICIYIFGFTPGQFFIGLRVVRDRDFKKPSASQSFIRSLLWCLELATGGFAWLAVLSHPERKILHDRASETRVICLDSKKSIGAPIESEKRFAHNIMVPAWSLVFLVFALVFTKIYSSDVDQDMNDSLSSSNHLCLMVSDAYQNWESNRESKPSRMSVALALFEAEMIDNKCLDLEANHSIWKDKNLDQALLAKALLSDEKSKSYKSFLKEVCRENSESDACMMSFELQSRLQKHDEAQELRKPASVNLKDVDMLNEKTAFYHIFHLKDLYEKEYYQNVLKDLEVEKLSSHFAEFLAQLKIKSLLERSQFDVAQNFYEAHYLFLTADMRLRLNAELCDAYVTNKKNGNDSKTQNTNVCHLFVNSFLDSAQSHTIEDEIYFLKWLFKTRSEIDYVKLKKKLKSKRSKELVDIYELQEDHKFEIAKQDLNELVKQTPDEFTYFIQTILVDQAKQVAELDESEAQYLKSDSAADLWGYQLAEKLLSFSEFKKAQNVADKLIKDHPNQKKYWLLLRDIAQKSGQKIMVQELDRKIKNL